MQASQESTGRNTRLWTKRKAREKKAGYRTDGEGGRENKRETCHKINFQEFQES